MLDALLNADGTGAAASEPAWRAFVEHVVEVLDVGPGTSVWDAGCGAGAFLYPLWENGYVVGGVDPDEALLARAREAMPEGRFGTGAAAAMDPAEPWDVVVASQGVRGCTDLDAARGLLARMAAKATHALALLQVNEREGGGLVIERAWMLRMMAENGATAVQFEAAPGGRGFNVFAKV